MELLEPELEISESEDEKEIMPLNKRQRK